MEDVYTYCAVFGGILFAIHFTLGLAGLGDDLDLDVGEVDVDVPDDFDSPGEDVGHGGGWFAGMLSLRAIVAAVTVFGLTGLGAVKSFDPMTAFIIALLAGLGVMYMVAWVMRSLHKLKDDGTVRIQSALGQNGSVYLTIPAERSGAGKVTINVQGRTMEYQAMTTGPKLETGIPIIVVGVIGPEMLEVAHPADANFSNEVPTEGNAHV